MRKARLGGRSGPDGYRARSTGPCLDDMLDGRNKANNYATD
jgi:hypothetical protein